jgi:hypothetical protein
MNNKLLDLAADFHLPAPHALLETVSLVAKTTAGLANWVCILASKLRRTSLAQPSQALHMCNFGS